MIPMWLQRPSTDLLADIERFRIPMEDRLLVRRAKERYDLYTASVIARAYDPRLDVAWTEEDEELVDTATMVWYTYDPPAPVYRFPWSTVDEIVGPIFPADILIALAGTGMGKTTLTMNVLANLPAFSRVHLYPTETSRIECVTRMAAMRARLRPDAVVEHDWPRAHHEYTAQEARDAFRRATAEAYDRRQISISGIVELRASDLERYVEQATAPPYHRNLIIVDHIGNLVHDMGRGIDAPLATMREMKRLGLQYNVAWLCTAQVNLREQAGRERILPPQLTHIYGGQHTAQFATVVLALHRVLRTSIAGEPITNKHFRQFEQGMLAYSDLIEPGVTGCTVLKHRRAGARLHETRRLRYDHGYLSEDTWAAPRALPPPSPTLLEPPTRHDLALPIADRDDMEWIHA
jgi:hypothetical protein